MKINLLKYGKKALTVVLAIAVLAVSLFSAVGSILVSAATVWDGTTADTEWEGDGTEASPYILSTAEEVYGMVTSGGNGSYYKIADDVDALYFNNVEGMDKAQATAFFTGETAKNSWYTGNTAFSGTFDGNGATLYGLYSTSEGYNAFINRVVHGSVATVKNVNFELCYFENTKAAANPWSYASGVVFGMVGATSAPAEGTAKATANINTVKITDCSTTSHNGAAILYGCAVNGLLNVNKVITIGNEISSDNDSNLAATLVVGGSGWNCQGGAVSNVIFTEDVDVLPVTSYVSNFFGESTSAYIVGSVREGSTAYFQNVTQDQMKGAAAQENMPGLTWGTGGFQVGAEGEYPTFAPELDYVVWNCTVDTAWEGLGTEESPYILSTAEEVYGMITSGGNGAYYKIADGVEALYFNAVKGMSKAQATEFFTGSAAKNNWYTGNTAFSGTFDGNGATLYGLYSTSEGYNAFINHVVHGGVATVKNVNFELCYFENTKASANPWSYASGVVFGMVGSTGAPAEGVTKATANINTVKITNSTATSHNGAAILYGCAVNGLLNLNRVVTIGNDIFSDNASANAANAAALVVGGSGWNCQGGTLSNVIFTEDVVVIPVASSVSNFFTESTSAYIAGTVRDNSAAYMTKVTQDQMKGEAAKTNMPGLLWGPGGYAVGAEGEYPTFLAPVEYASGTGTEADPFIIENADQLHKMVAEYGKDAEGNAAYFKVADTVDEIVINDVTGFSAATAAVGEGWTNWMDGLTYDTGGNDTGKSFVGKFNGNGVVIKGLYAYSVGSNSVGFIPCAGVGAEVKNVAFEAAYVKNDTRGAYEGAAVVAGRVNETAGSSIAISAVSVKNCYVSGGYAAAGFVGNARGNVCSVTTCILVDCNIVNTENGAEDHKKGGALADGWGKTNNVSDSIFIGIHAERKDSPYLPTFTNVYTDDTTFSYTNSFETIYRAPGVNQLDGADAAKGAAAKENMPDLSDAWLFTTDSYPELEVFHTHVWVEQDPIESDCPEVDAIVYDMCSCGKYQIGDEIVDTLPETVGHNPVDKQVTSDCEAVDPIAYKECACGQLFDAEGNEIDAVPEIAGHNPEIKTIHSACSKVEPIEYKECACGQLFDAEGNEIDTVPVPAGHDFEDKTLEPTCPHAEAIAYQQCRACEMIMIGGQFVEELPEANGHNPVDQEPITSECPNVAPITYKECACGQLFDAEGNEIDTVPEIAGHSPVDKQVVSDCGAVDPIPYKECACGQLFDAEGNEIDAVPEIAGHAWVAQDPIESECPLVEDIAYDKCDNCGKYQVGEAVLDELEDIKGHAYEKHTLTSECSEVADIVYYTCKCGKIFDADYKEITEVPEIAGHSYEKHTLTSECSEVADIVYYTCECGKIFNADYEEIAAVPEIAGHAYEKHTLTSECSEVADIVYYTCECGKIFNADYEEIAAVPEIAGHAPVNKQVTSDCSLVAPIDYKECACGQLFDAEGNEIEALPEIAGHTAVSKDYDETTHWDVCACGERFNVGEHTGDVCDCGYEAAPKYTEGWVLGVNGKYWYQFEDGTYPASDWLQLDGKWYYFDKDGYMTTGWQLVGTWYYMDENGEMVTGWKLIDGTWYYFASSGAMVTDWCFIDGTWYYFHNSGAMATGWLQLGDTWYYFNTSGAMATGWVLDGVWYYFNEGGAMVTGWLDLGGTWYFFNEGGAMLTGWQLIGSTWYYFYDSGAMAANCWVGDCWVDASGAWVA